jgi:uncharacterized protein YerC
MRMLIEQIAIGERRREDLGDIAGLATSIRRFGLLHPIVVDADNRLVAGERWLRAVQSTGERWIETKQLAELTDAELREIELEENLRRKDLTAIERSKTMVQLVEVARQVAETCTDSVQVSKPARGPALSPGSYRDVSQRTGIPVASIQRAEQHVEAVERYPELEAKPQSEAIQTAKVFDNLPEPQRAERREAMRAGGLPGIPPPPVVSPEQKAWDRIATMAGLVKLDPVAVAQACYSQQLARTYVDQWPAYTAWAEAFSAELRRQAGGGLRVVASAD